MFAAVLAAGTAPSLHLHKYCYVVYIGCPGPVQAQAAKSLHHSSHITPRRAQESLKRTFPKILKVAHWL